MKTTFVITTILTLPLLALIVSTTTIIVTATRPEPTYGLFCKGGFADFEVNCAASNSDTPDWHRLSTVCEQNCRCISTGIVCADLGGCDSDYLEGECYGSYVCNCFPVGPGGGIQTAAA